MAQQIGLEAVLDLGKFSGNVQKYLNDLDRMGKATGKFDDQTAGFGAQATKSFQNLGKVVLAAGAAIGIAAAAAGVAVGKFTIDGIRKAADLESQMSRIAATLNTTKEAAQPLKDLIMQLALDPKLVVTTNEAADAIENLAKNGVSMKDILDGVARSVVLLANSTGAEFGAAADVVTDVMAQFNLTAQDTEHAVNQITGVTNLSKLTFDDYALAIAQAGGAAGTLGVSFEDFNSVLIATNANFASGSDLGTSFKNFLTTLPGKSDKAKEAIAALGLEFFDAQGQMKSMAEISEELNQAFLNEVTFTSEVNNMTAEQTAQKKLLEQQLARTSGQLFLYEAGVNGVGQSEEQNAESVAKLNQQYSAAMTAYEGLAGSMGTTVTVRRNLTEAERIAYAQTIFGVDSMRLAFGMAEAGAVAYTDLATATKALGLEGKQLEVAQASLNKAFEDGKITMFEFGTAQAAAIDASAQAAERMRNFKGVMDILGGAIEGLQIMIGDAFLPILTELANMAVALVSAYGPNLVKPFQDFGAALGIFFTSLRDGQAPFDAFAKAMSTFGTQGTAIATAMGSIALAIGGVVVTIGMVLQPVTDAIGKFVEWQDVLIVLGVAIASVIVPALVGMVTAMAPVIAFVGGAILAVAALRTAWENDFLGIQTTTTAAIATITTAFEPFTLAVQQHARGALVEIQAFVSGSQTEFTNLSAILSAFQVSTQNLFTAISEAVSSVLPQWGAQFDALVERFPPLAAAIETLQSTWQTLVDFFSPSIARIADSLGTFGKHLTTLSDEFNALFKAVQSTITKIAPLIQTLGTVIGAVLGVLAVTTLNALAAVFEHLGEILEAAIKQMTLMIQSFGEVVEDLVNLVTALIEGDWASAWESFKELGQDALNLFIGSLENLSTVVGSVFLIIRDTIINTLADLGVNAPAELEKLTAAFQQWITDVQTAILEFDWFALGMQIIGGIQSGVETVTGTLISAFQTMANDAKNRITSINWKGIGSDVIRGIRDGAASMSGSLYSKITEIGNGIVSRFKAIIDKVKQIGRDIINGLINGIVSMKDKLLEKVAEMANLIPDWMKDALGIRSPSTVMMAIGKDVMRGFFIGLETGSVRLVELAEQITRTFTNTILSGTERAVDAFAGILDGWSSVGQGFADTMQTALDSITESFNNMLATGTGTGSQQFDMIRLMAQLQTGLGKYQANNRVLETLKQQSELIDLIRESGGQPSTVLAGIALGRDADPQQLLDVVNRMMETFNGRLEDSIKIAAQGFQELVDSLRKNRRTVEQIEAQFADDRIDQLERYKREVLRLDAEILRQEQELLTRGNLANPYEPSTLSRINTLNTQREQALENIRRYLEQINRLEATLSTMPAFRTDRAQAGADVFRERFIDPLVAAFGNQSVAQRETTLQQINRYLDMLRIYESRMQNATAATTHALRAAEGFGDTAQQRIENLLAVIYDVGVPAASRDNAIQTLRDFAASLNSIRTELTTRGAGREATENIIERATGGFDQLSAYKVAIADLDKRIASITDTIEETGNVNLLPQLRSLDVARNLSTDELKNFLVQVSQLEGAFRDIKNLTGPGETSAQRFVDEQIQPILDAFSAPMRPQDRQTWLLAAQQRVAMVNRFVDQMRVVEKLQQRIASVEGFNHLADEFAAISDIALPEADRTAWIRVLTNYITQMERLFALQKDLTIGLGADPLVERFKSERLDTIAKQLENINLSEAERVRLIEQYRIEQEKILAIQTKQNQLEFLQQQLSLLEKLKQLGTEEGFKVDVPNIIKGIGFGINASMDDLLALVSRVIDETVRFTNFKLGIKSPSKVFAEIGTYMMEGLARGIESSVMRPMNSLSGAISELPYSLGNRSLTLNMGGVNISNGMDEVMFESRVRQILDKAFP